MRPADHETIGLSSFQKELWLAHKALPEGHPGIFSGGRFLLEGVVDPQTAREALRRLVQHFPLFTATLEPGGDGLPVFRKDAHPEPDFRFVDVSAEAAPEAAGLAACTAFTESPFQPLGGPLIQFALVRVRVERAYFILKTFHLIGSGMGNALHFSLFSHLYEAIVRGRVPEIDLGERPDWQHVVDDEAAFLASPRALQDRRFWLDAIRNAPEERAFPPLPGHPDQLGDSAVCLQPMTADGMILLEKTLAATGTSPAILLTAAHAVALSLLLDRPVPVIVAVDNGERKDPRRMQGFMVNTMPIILPDLPDMTFAEAVQALALHMQQLRRHARSSLPAALREGGCLREKAHLWDTALNSIVDAFPEGNTLFSQRDFMPLYSRKDTALLHVDVLHGAVPGDPLRFCINYSRNHFTADDVRRYAARLEAVLATAHDHPERPLRAYSPLLDDERARLQDWESGGTKPVPALSIPQLFAVTAQTHATRTAVRGEDGSRRSYAQVCRNAGTLARRLRAMDVGRGEVVAVLARRHPALPECILGIMACGAVYLPIDPDYPENRIAHMLQDSGARRVVALTAEDRAVAPSEQSLLWIGESDFTEAPNTSAANETGRPDTATADWMPCNVPPTAPAYLIYTSGSTGTPKGVLVPHNGFVNMILAQIEAFGITPADRVLQFASPSFDASLSEIFMALMAGATACPVSRDRIDTPWALRDYMAQNAVSVVTFPPSYLAMFEGKPFPGLRVLLTAGEAPLAEDARNYAGQLTYFNAYGPTEASVCATLQHLTPDTPACTVIGRPLPNTQTLVLDSQGRRVVPGMAGELWLAGAGLALGYHGRPQLTAERFCEPAELPGIRCYRTGDRAVWTADGRLLLLGRTDNQVKIYGQRVELGEVASVLETHPLVTQAVVVAVPENGSHHLAAFLLPRLSHTPIDLTALRRWLLGRLPAYMLPGQFRLVAQFPLTPAGKIDRRALLHSLDSARRAEKTVAPMRPLSELETRLTALYAAVLGHEVSDPEQDFFQMGGDSLKAVSLLHKLEQACGLRLAMRDFIAASSVRDVAGRAKNSAETCASGPAMPDHAPLPLTEEQFSLWAQEVTRTPSASYHMPLELELRGNEAAVLRFVEAAREALSVQPLCTAHVGGSVEQPVFLPFSRPVPPCLRENDLHDRLETFIHAPFDLEKQPPVRLALFPVAENVRLFVLVMHHIAGDAVGLHAILRDALNLLAGTPLPQLDRIALLHAAVETERRFLASPQRKEEETFWRAALLPLPPALTSFASLSGEGGQIVTTLPPGSAEGLRRLARQTGTTQLGVMLGLLGTFLCRRAGQAECLVTVPVGTRENAASAAVSSYCVNAVPLRLTAYADAATASRKAGEALRTATAHSRLPARLLADALELSYEQRAVLTEIFATHMDMTLPPVPPDCGLDIAPRLPVLRNVKTAFSFLLLTCGPETKLALEYDSARLDSNAATNLLTDWAHVIALSVGDDARIDVPASTQPFTAQPFTTPEEPSSCAQSLNAAGRDALAQAWQQVLGTVPQPADHFFLSGGDSIKAIQLAGRLRQAGFSGFAPSACFQHPHFADLCARLADLTHTTQPSALPSLLPPQPGETIPLPPLHAVWVAQHPEDWQDFHMALPLRLHPHVDCARLKEGVCKLSERHEALRMRFTAADLQCDPAAPPLWLDRTFAAETPLEQCFAEVARLLFPQLSHARAAGHALYGCVLFRHGTTPYLLFAAHHFALDAVSLEIIRTELVAFCTSGHFPAPAPSCGAATWAKLLAKQTLFTSQEDAATETAFWRQLCADFLEQPAQHGTRTHAATPPRKILHRRVRGFAFDQTRRGGGLPELLAGLSAALQAPLLLTLETHGREEVMPGVDLSPAVGWFTAAFPLVIQPLHADCGTDLTEAAADWAARLDNLPRRGTRYAAVAANNPELRACRPGMSLNYLGAAFAAAETELLTSLPHFADSQALPGLLAPNFASATPLDVQILQTAPGELTFTISFAPDNLSPEAVAALLDGWTDALAMLAREREKAEADRLALAHTCLCAPEALLEVGEPDPAQEAMLYQLLLDTEQGQPAAHYVQQITFALRSQATLDTIALETAWQKLLLRHEGLRTLFPRTQTGVFRRVVLSEARFCAQQLDLSSLPPPLQQTRRDRQLREIRETPFDLAHGPLLFLTLFRRRDAQGLFWEMAWCFPHLLMDGWCLGIMLRELLALYAADCAGTSPILPEAPSLKNVRAALGSPDDTALRAYWTQQLEGSTTPSSIVATLARLFPETPVSTREDEQNAQNAQSAQSAQNAKDTVVESTLELDAATSRTLSRAAAALSATLPQLLQTAWAMLLDAEQTGDVLFGLVHSGRPAGIAGIEHVIGLFIRTLPVRVRWTAATAFADLVVQVRDAALCRVAHERDMLADIQPCRPGGGPLFDHLLVFENYPLEGITLDGEPRIEAVEGFERQPYPLAVSILTGATCTFRFTCDTRRIAPEQLHALLAIWRRLLETLAKQLAAGTTPTCRDLQHAVFPQDTAASVPEFFNTTSRPYERDTGIHTLFLETARRFPEHPACCDMDGGVWSYAELAVAASRVARALNDLDAGEPVALAMPRCAECVAVMLGVLMAGGCYMPLDGHLPTERLRTMLHVAHCRRVVLLSAPDHTKDNADNPEYQLPADTDLEQPLQRLDAATLLSGPAVDTLALHRKAPGGEAPAYIMFTSGTTGVPKGVRIPHRAVLRLVRNSSFWTLLPGERVGQTGPFGFDASTLELWGPLLNGGTICFLDTAVLLSPPLLTQQLRERGITILWLTAGLFSMLAAEDPALFRPLRCLYSGGDTMSVPHAARVLAACPELELYNGYGPTESTTFLAVHRVAAADVAAGAASMPLGRPISNSRAYIVTEKDTLAGVGEWGELCAAGDGLALGYCGTSAAAAFRFLPAAGERVYYTGDLARWRADGVLEFRGRRDAQIKLRGFRIEPEEIENALLRLPGVKDAAVTVTGNGADKQLVGFVTGAETVPEQQLRAALSTTLPDYMIPGHIFPCPQLPINSNGKHDRRTLTLLAEEQLENWKRSRAARPDTANTPNAVAGQTVEEGVAAIFSAVLHIPVRNAEDDFFLLGGQSLKAMKLLARLNGAFGVTLNLSEIMRLGTVGALAARITELRRATRPETDTARPVSIQTPLPAPEIGSEWPLSPAQEQFWFQQQLYPDSPVYTIVGIVRLQGTLDADALQRALLLVEERHEVLRLRLSDSTARVPHQKLFPAGSLRLHLHDCRALADPVGEVARLAAEEQARPFRFGYAAPLSRACCFLESDDAAVFMLLTHHCLTDGWSFNLIQTDLEYAYRLLEAGNEVVWPDTPRSFVRLVEERNARRNGPDEQALLRRWVQRLSPLPEPLDLPADRPRPVVRSFTGGVVVSRIPSGLRSDLYDLAAQHGVALFPVLLTLTEIFCFRHTGARDMLFGIPVACRNRLDEQNVAGLLMNVIPLRLVLNDKSDVAACIHRCAEAFLDVLNDAECPMETLLHELAVPRDAGRNPLFDVFVAFEEQSWMETTTFGSLRTEPYAFAGRQSRLDMSLLFRDKADHLEIIWEYSDALFDRTTVERMAARFLRLVEAVCDPAADQTVARLPLIPPAELCILEQCNATRTDWDCSGGMDRLFAAQTARTPDAPALHGADSSLSYAELHCSAGRLADWLRAQGVQPGQAVGVCFPRGIEMMTAIFAVIRAGGLYVPVVPGLPVERLRAMLENLPAGTVLLTGTEHVAELTAPAAAQQVRVLQLPAFDDLAAQSVPPLPTLPTITTEPPVADDALAYILFTSGSTGRPKGVMVEQRGVLNRLFWMQSRHPLGPDDVILQKTSISFDVSVWELFWWSWYGASLALLAPGEERDPAAIVDAVERHKVTVMHFVPSMLRIFLEHCAHHPEAAPRLTSLRRVFASGEALTPDCVQLFNKLLFATNGTELHNLYGPTEATVDVTYHACSPFPDDAVRVPIGRPVSNTTITIQDSEGQIVPLGVSGELVISGIQVARGYANRPDLTAHVFGLDPATGERCYRTGDLARWTPGGVVDYLGRKDDQVKIRGVRIELGEVEAVLESCPCVAQAVTRVGSIGGLPALEAYLLPVQGKPLSLSAIREVLHRRLPASMHPSVLYRTDAIPLGSSGKANRKALRGELLSAQTATSAISEISAISANSLEGRIRTCWRAILPEAGDLPANLSFFDAGGSSLLLVRLLDRLQEQWPDAFTLPELFASPTIEAQAEKLRAGALPAQQPEHHTGTQGGIAVIGMALRLADYDDADAFWSDLRTEADRMRPLPEQRLQEQRAMLVAAGLTPDSVQDAAFKPASYLNDISGFDYARFNIAPGDARLIDPEQRLFFSTALRALEDAGYGGNILDNAAVGVFVGASALSPFRQAVMRSLPELAEQTYILNVPSAIATRLSYLHNWSGPAAVVDTACSSVLVALHHACAALRSGACTLALAGGERLQLALLDNARPLAIESSSNRTLSFDADASGTCAGEGAVAFLLKPLDKALADGDAVHAVIRGSAVNQDGHSSGIAAPNPAAQAAVIQAAARDAGLTPGDLHFIEAHGTGTKLGDPVEIDGLRRAFAASPLSRSLPVSSVKGNFGHLDAAAGGLGLAKAILVLRHGEVPGQPYFTRPNPHIDFAAACVHVPKQPERLPEDGHPWRGGISAFGLSGINAHLIIEEAPRVQHTAPDAPDAPNAPEHWYCVPFSASTPDGLRRLVRETLTALDDTAVRSVAGTLTCGRAHLPFRAAFVAATPEQLRAKLLRWLLAGGESRAVTALAEQALVICTAREAAQQVATAFLHGATPKWDATPFVRVHLPAVPLEPTPCWPAFPMPATHDARWPGEAAATPQGRQYPVPVNEIAFWPLTEHRVAGRPTLVGMAFPSLVGNAAKREHPDAPVSLSNVQWHRPLTPEDCAEATLSLSPQDTGFAVTLAGCSRQATWTTFAAAQLTLQPVDAPKKQDMPTLCADLLPLRIPAADYPTTPVQVSERWQCRQAAWRSADGRVTVARLVLPPRYLPDLARLPWHPALLDIAASLALGDVPLLPGACARIVLRQPLPPQLWARCTLRSVAEDQRARVADCTLYADDGTELVSLEGLAFLPLRHPAPRLHSLDWIPLDLSALLDDAPATPRMFP